MSEHALKNGLGARLSLTAAGGSERQKSASRSAFGEAGFRQTRTHDETAQRPLDSGAEPRQQPLRKAAGFVKNQCKANSFLGKIGPSADGIDRRAASPNSVRNDPKPDDWKLERPGDGRVGVQGCAAEPGRQPRTTLPTSQER